MIKTLALILKKQDLGETDRIITVLTPALGKKRIVARAVRRPLSKLAGHLDSLMVSQIILTDKPELPNVTSAVLVESFENVRDSLELLNQTYAVGRVVERLAEEDTPQQSLFQSTVDAFSRIDSNRNWPATWLYFLTSLSKYYGVYVTGFTCENCKGVVDSDGVFSFEDRAIFHLDHAPTTRTRRLSGNSIKLLKLLQSKPYEMISKINIPISVGAELEEILLVELIENYGSAPWKKYACLARDDR